MPFRMSGFVPFGSPIVSGEKITRIIPEIDKERLSLSISDNTHSATLVMLFYNLFHVVILYQLISGGQYNFFEECNLKQYFYFKENIFLKSMWIGSRSLLISILSFVILLHAFRKNEAHDHHQP